MSRARRLSIGVPVGFLVAMVWVALPSSTDAAWVNGTGTQFQVAGKLVEIVPTAAGTTLADPTCGSQGGTSLALVPGRKVPGVDAVLHPVVLVVSCLDNANATVRRRLNFVNPVDVLIGGVLAVPRGRVLRQFLTSVAPGNGWTHLVHRPDKGDLVGCGADGTLYRIDYSLPDTSTPQQVAATAVANKPGAATTCKGLAWDAEADVIYQGLSVSGGAKIGRVVSFKEGATTLVGDFTNLPCPANGLAITGGVLMLSCEGSLALHRLNKGTGATLGVHGTLTATGLTALSNDPGLGDLACDPESFHKDATGKDLFTDALWSRRGANGNGVAALEFPAFTCGLPSSSVVVQNQVSFSPLAAGLSAPGSNGPGQVPLAACFDANGRVKDADGDGLPDCWETNAGGSGNATGGGIDFDGDGSRDVTLCASVDTNGDGVNDATECADPNRKNLFVEIDWMQEHKPSPQALSQAVTVTSVQSVRAAFAAAPVGNPDATSGIRIHFQVADEPVVITPLSGPPTNHVNQVAFTPCTGPATGAVDPAQAADFDDIKKVNFGTAAERASPNAVKILNAKRLAFRYVLFAHNLIGNPSGGSTGSGCAEVRGDDGVVSLGSFMSTTVNGVSHNRGTTDQQAGTFMHEFGHMLGLEHGGHDTINCKPNYRSVMGYPRQFANSPIPSRRLDYSRSADPVLPADPANSGVLNEASLNEFAGLGVDPSLGPILPYFPSADQIAYGPSAWSVATPTTNPVNPINWNRSKQGPNPTFQSSATADINAGSTSGCIASLGDSLEGHDDWSNIVYRASAGIAFAGGVRAEEAADNPGETPVEITMEQEEQFFLGRDADGNGAADGTDCGGTVLPDWTTGFSCLHRIDIKPSFSSPKMIKLGAEATVSVAIFSEVNGNQIWDATKQVKVDDLQNFPLTFSVGGVTTLVKANNRGLGTCSGLDVDKNGVKDFVCQFATSGLPKGTDFGIVAGYFSDPLTGEIRAFVARQEVTILP